MRRYVAWNAVQDAELLECARSASRHLLWYPQRPQLAPRAGAVSFSSGRGAGSFGRLVRSSLVHVELLTVPRSRTQEETMKLKLALIGLAALGSLAAAGTASAMPLAPLSPTSNVESVALVCGPRGCVRTVPAYRRGVVVVR